MSEDFTSVDNEEQKKRKVSKEEFERRRKEKHKERNRKRVLLVVVIIAALALLVSLVALGTGAVSSLMKNAGVKIDVNYVAKTQAVQVNNQGDVKVFSAGENVFVCENHQLICYNSSAVILWKESVESFVSPEFISSGEFLIIYDTEGTSVFAYGAEGKVWEKRFSGKVKNVYINEKNGIGAAVYEDGTYKSSVAVFKAENKKVTDLFTKNYASMYVLSCDVSDHGKSLAVSGVSAEEGTLKGIITLINVDGGESYYTKYTDEYVLPYVSFVSNEKLCAAGSEELAFIENTMKVDSSSAESAYNVIKKGEGVSKLLAVNTARGFVVSVFGSGDGGCDVSVCGENGKVISNESYDENIIGAVGMGENGAFYSDNKIYFIDGKGKVLCEFDDYSFINDVRFVSPGRVFVSHGSGYGFVEFVEE